MAMRILLVDDYALFLCEGPVKLHVSAIMRASGVRNRTEAAVVAEQFT